MLVAGTLRIVVASFAVASSSVVALPAVVASLVAVATLVAVVAACSLQIVAEIVVEHCRVAYFPAGTHSAAADTHFVAGTHSAVAGTHFPAGASPRRTVCLQHWA